MPMIQDKAKYVVNSNPFPHLGYADSGDYYESAKFGGHCQLMLSHSVLKVVRANAAWRDRRLAH
jgi:hypothetical protein